MRPIPLAFGIACLLAVALLRRRASRDQLAIGIVVAIGFLVYSTGWIHFPSLEHVVEQIGKALGVWTYLLVGALAYLETGAFVGLIAPGEFTVILGGVVAGQGKINIVVLIALVWFCAVAGDLTSYELGRRLGREWLVRNGPRVKITEARLMQVEDFFERHGGATILIGRFIGLVRALAPFIAGSAKLPLRRFLPYDIVAAGAWSATFCLLGYLFWNSFHAVVDIAKKGSLAFGTVVTVVVLAVIAYRELRDPARRAALRASIEARPALRWLLVVGDRLARPARFVWLRFAPGELGLDLTTLVAIAAVGGFGFGALVAIAKRARPPSIDRWAHDLAVDLHAGVPVAVARVITVLGVTGVVAPAIAIATVFVALRSRWYAAAALAAGGILSFVASPIAKGLVDRPRPHDALVTAAGSSFPSGHAIHAIAWVAIAIVLTRLLPQRGARIGLVAGAAVLALLIGATRIYLRAHWLTDVVAGWGLAAALFALCGVIALVVAHLRDNARDA